MKKVKMTITYVVESYDSEDNFKGLSIFEVHEYIRDRFYTNFDVFKRDIQELVDVVS